jgi:hypothetical protein
MPESAQRRACSSILANVACHDHSFEAKRTLRVPTAPSLPSGIRFSGLGELQTQHAMFTAASSVGCGQLHPDVRTWSEAVAVRSMSLRRACMPLDNKARCSGNRPSPLLGVDAKETGYRRRIFLVTAKPRNSSHTCDIRLDTSHLCNHRPTCLSGAKIHRVFGVTHGPG